MKRVRLRRLQHATINNASCRASAAGQSGRASHSTGQLRGAISIGGAWPSAANGAVCCRAPDTRSIDAYDIVVVSVPLIYDAVKTANTSYYTC